MSLTDYMIKAFSIGLVKDELSNKWYVDPWWEINMYTKGYRYNDFINVDCWKMMDAECARRNLQDSKVELVADWVWNVLNTSVDPAIINMQNGLTDDVISYLQTKYSDNKDKLSSILNFAKKDQEKK